MADEIARLGIEVLSDDIVKATKRLDALENQSGKNEKANKRLSSSYGALKTAIGLLGVGAITKQVIDQINTYTALSNKLKLVTKDSQELASVQKTLFNIAQDTRASLEGTSDLYSRLARSTRDLNLSSGDLASVTQTINQAIAVSGSTAQEASASLFQLGQGLSAGALRGEELNSVMEQTPRLAQAIADGLGVSIGELRKMGAEGKLNAERVIGALQGQADVINGEFLQTEKTVSQALLQIENTALQTFGSISGEELVGALDQFRQTISDPEVVNSLQAIAAALIKITSATIAAIPELNKLGETAGKKLSNIFHPVAKDVSELDGEIAILTDRLNQISIAADQAEKDNPGGILGFFAPDRESVLQTGRAIEDQIAQLQKLREERVALFGEPQAGPNIPEPATQQAEKKKPPAVLEIEKELTAAEQRAIERERAAAQRKDDEKEADLERLRTKYATEYELLDEKEQAELDLINERLEAKRLSLGEHEQLMTEITAEYAQKRAAIEQAEMNSRVDLLQSALGAIENLMSTGGKKQFQIAKTAAIANAIINTYQSVQSALATNPFFPVGIAMGAIALTNGLANIQRIKQTQYGGTSVGGTATPTTAAAGSAGITRTEPSAPSQQQNSRPPQELNVTFTGDAPGSEAMRKFVDDLATTIEDMGGVARINIS